MASSRFLSKSLYFMIKVTISFMRIRYPQHRLCKVSVIAKNKLKNAQCPQVVDQPNGLKQKQSLRITRLSSCGKQQHTGLVDWYHGRLAFFHGFTLDRDGHK